MTSFKKITLIGVGKNPLSLNKASLINNRKAFLGLLSCPNY